MAAPDPGAALAVKLRRSPEASARQRKVFFNLQKFTSR
jgi:hypothetical protein